ncbi:MAG TPA: P1 family peptidase [Pilimelia sp.]|nr:P1 family peptidase [Pilimelia sp.]
MTKVRARGLGLPLPGEPGAHNAITDVPGVEVGYVTLVEGDAVRTGVTALLPRGRAGVGTPCTAGWYSLNGNGEMTGTTWISETGALDLPVLITNTHAVGPVHRGAIEWVVGHRPDLAGAWLLPVVAETWDGYLNDINGDHVRPRHAVEAIDAARPGPVAEGAVGGGTGMNCYGFKAGSGTASRRVAHGPDTYTVGAFVQANFGSRAELRVAGVPVGAALADDDPLGDPGWLAEDLAGAVAPPGSGAPVAPPGAGSVIAVVATDAPLLPGQCTALARRVPLGLARTGTAGSHFSGDIFLAFSTADAPGLASRFPVGPATAEDYGHLRFLPWGRLDPFYTAVVEAVEEAVLNALVAGREMTGRLGRRSPGLPHERLVTLLRRRGALAPD